MKRQYQQLRRTLDLAEFIYQNYRLTYAKTYQIFNEFAAKTGQDFNPRTIKRDLDFLFTLGIVECQQDLDERQFHGYKAFKWKWAKGGNLFIERQIVAKPKSV